MSEIELTKAGRGIWHMLKTTTKLESLDIKIEDRLIRVNDDASDSIFSLLALTWAGAIDE